MSKEERSGRRSKRQTGFRKPNLGYYKIITDARETEVNYFNGIKVAMPEALRGRIVIKIKSGIDTKSLVQIAKKSLSEDPQVREIWIVFDRDSVKNFDDMIREANESGISVGWSNPCIETWFYAYFGSMPRCTNSQDSLCKFSLEFKKKTNKEYNKNDDKIYENLCKHGDEKQAIAVADSRFMEAEKNSEDKKPSSMSPCTTVHKLVGEIKGKIESCSKGETSASP